MLYIHRDFITFSAWVLAYMIKVQLYNILQRKQSDYEILELFYHLLTS